MSWAPNNIIVCYENSWDRIRIYCNSHVMRLVLNKLTVETLYKLKQDDGTKNWKTNVLWPYIWLYIHIQIVRICKYKYITLTNSECVKNRTWYWMLDFSGSGVSFAVHMSLPKVIYALVMIRKHNVICRLLWYVWFW